MKKYRLEILLAPIFLIVSIFIFARLFSFDYLQPVRQALIDFDITDIGLQIGEEGSYKKADTNIVIVDIGKFNKKKLYYLLSVITQYNPKVIGINEVVPEEGEFIFNDSLSAICGNFPNIVFGSILKQYSGNLDEYLSIERSWGKFLLNTHTGFINLPFGKDKTINTVRRFKKFTKVSGIREYSFAYKVSSIFDSSSAKVLTKRGYDSEIIHYFGNEEIFMHLSARDVFLNNFSPDIFVNKIVLIGHAPVNSRTKLLDFMCFTPYSTLDEGRPLPDMYETVIQANIIKMVLDRKFYNKIPSVWTLILTLILIYINFYIFYIISDKIPLWYEILSNLLFLIQSIFILVLVLVLYEEYKIYADLTMALLALAMVIIIFEAYRDSFIPFTKIIINRFKKRGSK